MSRYIGKRVIYECGFCKKQFTLNKQSVDDSEKSGEVFCSKQCSEQFYLSEYTCAKCNKLMKEATGHNSNPELVQDPFIYCECGVKVYLIQAEPEHHLQKKGEKE